MIFGKQVSSTSLSSVVFGNWSICKDTHVPRAGRDLIRKSLEDANVPVSVCTFSFFGVYRINAISVPGGTGPTRLHPRREFQREMGRCLDTLVVQLYDGGI
jgi:hypothetical protein